MAGFFRLVVEELGYAECRIDAPRARWHAGLFSQVLPSLLCSLGVWAIRYYQLQLIWWFPPIAAKALLMALCCWGYVRWLNPLEYESVAVKRTRGVEICTRWRRFEHAVVIPFKDLVAVTIQEVSDRRLLLTFQGRSSTVHQAFKQTEPGLFAIAEVYTSISVLLPRQVKKGRVLSLLRGQSRAWAVTRWAVKEADFLTAYLLSWRRCVADHARAAWHWWLRKYNKLRSSERFCAWADAAAPVLDRFRWLLEVAAAASRLVSALGPVASAAWRQLSQAAAAAARQAWEWLQDGGEGGGPGWGPGLRQSRASGAGPRGSSNGGSSNGGSGGGSRGEGVKRPKSRNKGRKH